MQSESDLTEKEKIFIEHTHEEEGGGGGGEGFTMLGRF
jgi:hypothetical protein